jgi:hypothetical protein
MVLCSGKRDLTTAAHSSSELHVPIITVSLLEPDDVVATVGEGLVMGEALTTVGTRDVGVKDDGVMVVGEEGRRVHSPVPSSPDTLLQYASNPSQVFEHLAIIQVASLSPSHSSKGAMLEAA